MNTKAGFVVGLIALTFLGFGCPTTEVSDLTPEQASDSLALSVGDEIIIRPTVLGVGGTLVGWLGGEQDERTLTLLSWTAGQEASLSWSITTQVETEESVQARAAYTELYAQSPVGTAIPEEPAAVYESKLVEGSIASESLKDADKLMLPETWPEGEGGIVEASLVWLPLENYEELVGTRKTSISLGLFDESLMKVENATSQLKLFVDNITGLLAPLTGGAEPEEETQEANQSDSLTTLEADPDWGEFTLEVDGVRTSVRTIEAKNAFASYKILANPENPLILEIQLTPLSQGNLELLSTDGIAEGFGGYEVTRIKSNTAP